MALLPRVSVQETQTTCHKPVASPQTSTILPVSSRTGASAQVKVGVVVSGQAGDFPSSWPRTPRRREGGINA